ncbi:MAG: ATP-binding cassette domain-containing protein [Candidatus Heimdallarchaeota archaeon]|nr:ATP-binding cassette domain-containing protein [Candidatus Heimdallarchaeota archaeon]MDH5645134.1 ATP-binding cassette domain-containing protein [Candidatus Heimdallarchaeota archaeon]
MSPEIIQLKDVHFSIGQTQILHGISLNLSKSKIHCLVGPNGAGKSITNQIVGLIKKPNSGKIIWDDKELNLSDENETDNYSHKIGYMWQKPVFLRRSLRKNVELPLVFRDIPREERLKIVDNMLTAFKLSHLADKLPHQLSIGQQQKVALLRSIIHKPNILILDEPTASLDNANTLWFENYISNLVKNENIMVLWTTHDQFQMKRIADEISIIIEGSISLSGDVSLLESTSSDEKTQAYLNGKLI